MAAVLVVAWALGVAVSGAKLPWASTEVRESAVLDQVNGVMPAAAVEALNSFNDVVGSSFFPRYLEPFAPERIVKVGPPPPGIARDPDVQRTQASVFKIRGENGCGRGVEGSGFVYGPDRLMTNAHVVAGVSKPTVVVGEREIPATVVYYNPEHRHRGARRRRPAGQRLQVRVRRALAAAGGGARLPAGRPVQRAAGSDPRPAAAALARHLRQGHGRAADVYSLRGLVRPGNSGGPIVSSAGRVLGVVFAASVTDNDTGYALTAGQVARPLRRA